MLLLVDRLGPEPDPVAPPRRLGPQHLQVGLAHGPALRLQPLVEAPARRRVRLFGHQPSSRSRDHSSTSLPSGIVTLVRPNLCSTVSPEHANPSRSSSSSSDSMGKRARCTLRLPSERCCRILPRKKPHSLNSLVRSTSMLEPFKRPSRAGRRPPSRTLACP